MGRYFRGSFDRLFRLMYRVVGGRRREGLGVFFGVWFS